MAMFLIPSRALAVLSTGLLSAFVSAQFTEDFDDQDLTNGPVWGGSSEFIANVDGELQLNALAAGTSHLSTPFAMASLDNSEWRVKVRQGFAPSDNNYGRVYLVSDQADLTGPLNGYFLQFGENGSADAIELFLQTGTTTTSVCRGTDGAIAAPFTVGVRVDRDAAGVWQLSVDPAGGTAYALEASGTDATVNSSAFLGVRCTYTVSNIDDFFFDDLYAGPIVVDATPPTLISATAVSATEADLVFSEEVDAATAAESMHYTLDCGATVTAAALQNATTVRITFAPPLASGTTCTATVNGVLDLAGNASNNTTADFLYFVADVAEPGDVIINEIMADPDPAVGLPPVEFIEIHNITTNKTLDLAGWTLTDGNGTGTLPSATLAPGGFAILCDDGNAALFTAFGLTVGFASFPSSLTNTGEPLDLKNANGVTIDAVSYSDQWYNDDVKVLGGWTLERVDPTTPCSSAANWTASNDPQGGTPGEQNSVYAIVPDVTAPVLVSVLVNNDTEVELVFSEAMSVASLLAGSYQFSPALSVDLVVPINDHQVQLTLSAALVVGQLYTVTVTGVTDCVGNAIVSPNALSFALPEPVLPGDVVINEVLYDPLGSGSDFVELYNRSSKVLSLAGWKLANETDGVIGSATVITTAAFLLMPGEYALVTESATNIAEQYPSSHTDRFVETDMPSYNNGEGVVVLQDPLGATLDRFAYNDDLHFVLLNSTDGVSLERVSPARPTEDNTNWHSAAEPVGYATPGYENSQYSPTSTIAGEMTIERAIFSPDNDGFEDVLTITYKFEAAGFTGTMKIFDVAGREMKTLINNQLLGTVGSVSWDGIRTEGDLARMGPYIVMLEAFDLDGNMERFRETVVLAHKLN